MARRLRCSAAELPLFRGWRRERREPLPNQTASRTTSKGSTDALLDDAAVLIFWKRRHGLCQRKKRGDDLSPASRQFVFGDTIGSAIVAGFAPSGGSGHVLRILQPPISRTGRLCPATSRNRADTIIAYGEAPRHADQHRSQQPDCGEFRVLVEPTCRKSCFLSKRPSGRRRDFGDGADDQVGALVVNERPAAVALLDRRDRGRAAARRRRAAPRRCGRPRAARRSSPWRRPGHSRRPRSSAAAAIAPTGLMSIPAAGVDFARDGSAARRWRGTSCR